MSVQCSAVGVRAGKTQIITDVSFDVATGEWLTIIGPNGAGKSTLMRALVGIAQYDGDITVDGTSVGALAGRDRAAQIAYLPQSPVVPPRMSVLDYVLLGVTPRISEHAWPGDQHVAEAVDALSQFGIDELAGRFVESLSGGERQMALVARAMVQQARVLVLDEPTTALDLGHQQQVLQIVDDLRRIQQVTVVSVMHDLGLAAQYGDRVMLMANGTSVATGQPSDVLKPEIIAEHYGAQVDVIEHNGQLVVVPTANKEQT